MNRHEINLPEHDIDAAYEWLKDATLDELSRLIRAGDGQFYLRSPRIILALSNITTPGWRGEPRETNHGHGLRSYRYLHGAAEGPRFYKIELGKPCSGKAIFQECSEAFRKNDDETATGCH